jgi:hypothetical protein
MDETTRARLLAVALAQRSLSIGLGMLPLVIVGGGVAMAFGGGGREAEMVVRVAIVLLIVLVAAVTLRMSRVLGDARGLRLTLALAAAFVPFAVLVVPPVLLWRARRMLRAAGVRAGFFTTRRSAMTRLRWEAGEPGVCADCGYDLTGLAVPTVCPECGASTAAHGKKMLSRT